MEAIEAAGARLLCLPPIRWTSILSSSSWQAQRKAAERRSRTSDSIASLLEPFQKMNAPTNSRNADAQHGKRKLLGRPQNAVAVDRDHWLRWDSEMVRARRQAEGCRWRAAGARRRPQSGRQRSRLAPTKPTMPKISSNELRLIVSRLHRTPAAVALRLADERPARRLRRRTAHPQEDRGGIQLDQDGGRAREDQRPWL